MPSQHYNPVACIDTILAVYVMLSAGATPAGPSDGLPNTAAEAVDPPAASTALGAADVAGSSSTMRALQGMEGSASAGLAGAAVDDNIPAKHMVSEAGVYWARSSEGALPVPVVLPAAISYPVMTRCCLPFPFDGANGRWGPRPCLHVI